MSVQSQITRLKNAKSNLRTAIQGKGVSVPTTTKLDGYSSLVNQIPTGTDLSGTFNGYWGYGALAPTSQSGSVLKTINNAGYIFSIFVLSDGGAGYIKIYRDNSVIIPKNSDTSKNSLAIWRYTDNIPGIIKFKNSFKINCYPYNEAKPSDYLILGSLGSDDLSKCSPYIYINNKSDLSSSTRKLLISESGGGYITSISLYDALALQIDGVYILGSSSRTSKPNWGSISRLYYPFPVLWRYNTGFKLYADDTTSPIITYIKD